MDIGKHIAHWRAGSSEDWEVACSLVKQERVRHGLFFAHLSLEKILKAHVCRATRELSPPIHNLLRLAECAGLSLQEEQRDLLAEVNSFNIEGRYPEMILPLPTQLEAEAYLQKIRELLQCFQRMF